MELRPPQSNFERAYLSSSCHSSWNSLRASPWGQRLQVSVWALNSSLMTWAQASKSDPASKRANCVADMNPTEKRRSPLGFLNCSHKEHLWYHDGCLKELTFTQSFTWREKNDLINTEKKTKNIKGYILFHLILNKYLLKVHHVPDSALCSGGTRKWYINCPHETQSYPIRQCVQLAKCTCRAPLQTWESSQGNGK